MMGIKRRKIIFIMFICMLSVVICGCNSKRNSNDSFPKEIKIGIIRVPNDTQVAIKKDIFKKHFTDKGIEVKFIFFDSGVAANQAFAAGSIDFAEMGYTNAVVACANNLPVELIWIHEVLGENEALVVKNNANIKEIKELAGKKIATPFSSTSHFSLLKALSEAGIEKKVTLLDMETAEIAAAWNRGDLDAAYTWEPTLSEIKKTGTTIIDSKQLAERGYMTTNIELVNTKFSEKYTELVKEFILVLNEAGELYTTNPSSAAQYAADGLNISKEEALRQMKSTRWLTPKEQISKNYFGTDKNPGDYYKIFKETASFLKDQDAIKSIPTDEKIESFINSRYINEAILKQK